MDDIAFFTLIVCVVGLALPTLFLVFGDHADVVDVRAMGEKMCAQHKLAYDHRVIAEDRSFVVFCKNESKRIEDGYLRLA